MSIAEDYYNGLCCSHCGEYFIEPHSYPVLCNECYDSETETERAGLQKAHIQELSSMNEDFSNEFWECKKEAP